MSVRYCCDVCTREVKNPETAPIFRTEVVLRKPVPDHTPSRQVIVQITRAIDGAWDAGHLCGRCLRDALKQVRETLRGAR